MGLIFKSDLKANQTKFLHRYRKYSRKMKKNLIRFFFAIHLVINHFGLFHLPFWSLNRFSIQSHSIATIHVSVFVCNRNVVKHSKENVFKIPWIFYKFTGIFFANNNIWLLSWNWKIDYISFNFHWNWLKNEKQIDIIQFWWQKLIESGRKIAFCCFSHHHHHDNRNGNYS